MSDTVVANVVFYALAVLAVAGAAWVALARNIIHSAFALLATFLGVAGLYALLSADLVAVIQLLVYVGGVLVLILFAVMLTSRIGEARVSNTSFGVVPSAIVGALLAGALTYVALSFRAGEPAPALSGSTAAIGEALLGEYVLPFEVISVVLLAALLGGVTLARGPRRSETRPAEPVSGQGASANPSEEVA